MNTDIKIYRVNKLRCNTPIIYIPTITSLLKWLRIMNNRQFLIKILLAVVCLSFIPQLQAAIIIDGNASDWTEADRLEVSSNSPVAGYALYGRYENNNYNFLLKSDTTTISANTTIWLNTDQNGATGHQIWGFVGGAEYNINFDANGIPALYSGYAGQTHVGNITYSWQNSGGTSIVELQVAESLIGTPANEIRLLMDINNTQFLPTYYSNTNQYSILRQSTPPGGNITIDGDASDWAQADRLDLPPNTPVAGYELYGRYENNNYNLLLKSNNGTIGANTTVWINTDENATTGHQIWGFVGGVEYNINFDANGIPALYSGSAGQTSVGAITHAAQQNGNTSIVEMQIPQNLMNTPANEIRLLLDINNTQFLPTFYSNSSHYTVQRQSLPPVTNSDNKRIGIVYSQTTANHFWGAKAYAQLFMSTQTQAMMAGVPFDLLQETDLLDLETITRYDTLVFPYFSHVPDEHLDTIASNLSTAVFDHGIGLVAAGNLLTNKADGTSQDGDAYSRMKNLMGLTRLDGAGPADVIVRPGNVTHPALAGEYQYAENILEYSGTYTDYFVPTGNYASSVLATQDIDGIGVQNAMLATQTGGRNIHFGSILQMTDSNLLWSAIRWSVYGDEIPVSLRMSRNKALFVSRNDMDQSMFFDDVQLVEFPLLNLLAQWKNDYNFVGSYYINVGNNQAAGEYTQWPVSAPLYQQYIALGNEIGTHSYTHPHDTNILTPAQIAYEFADSRSVIENQMGLSNIGAAVPGAPENLQTSHEIIQHVNYLTGGYSGTGAGFPNAMGFLTPEDQKVYLSPNMTFDFTNIGFLGLSAAEAEAKWQDEFATLTNHANQAIVHWPWHDYGAINPYNEGYTVSMFASLIQTAANYGVEFVTGDDLQKRIKTYVAASLEVDQTTANQLTVNVSASEAGQFAVQIPSSSTSKISSVNNWYAYNDSQIFTTQNGGSYDITLGATATQVTRITEMPQRSQLLTLTGNGEDLTASVYGEGKILVKTRCSNTPSVSGSNNATASFSASQQLLTITLNQLRQHTLNVQMNCP
uniref:Uncharacterized protein n=1 Tax=uncultured Thiotrichaceae bacterium TaxID=298394 RepID=A0A6S6UIK3_9GAMM|nr:MAG: Unknown protein [uncultured Thiotrichaceae bacterium]